MPFGLSRKTFSRVAALAAVLVLTGLGCDLSQKINLRSPFEFGGVPEPPKPPEVRLKEGLALTIRPSYLGISGSLSDVLGSDDGAKKVKLTKVEMPVELELDWQAGEKIETAASVAARAEYERRVKVYGSATSSEPEQVFENRVFSGNVLAKGFAGSSEILPPSFWKTGPMEVDGNSVIWLSPKAFDELASGSSTELRVGLGDNLLSKTVAALDSFNRAVARLSGRTPGPDALSSVFRTTVKEPTGVFPVRVDGRIENLPVLRASSWFADYVIYMNPLNPLILKLSVNPLASGALTALSPLGVDSKEIGYEVTEMTTGEH